MADELDPNPNQPKEDYSRQPSEQIRGSADHDEEEFEDIDESDSDEDDLES